MTSTPDNPPPGGSPGGIASRLFPRERRARLFALVAIGAGLLLGTGHVRGILGYTDDYPLTLSTEAYARLFARFLPGPCLVVVTAAAVLYLLSTHKRVPRWLALVGALGGVHGFSALREGYAHDFSHAIFDSCTGYGEFGLGLGSTAAISLALACSTQPRPAPCPPLA